MEMTVHQIQKAMAAGELGPATLTRIWVAVRHGGVQRAAAAALGFDPGDFSKALNYGLPSEPMRARLEKVAGIPRGDWV